MHDNRQVKAMGVSVSTTMPSDLSPYTCIVDAVFGFSFKGANNIRAPFNTIIPALMNTNVPVASVDVPSGFPFLKRLYEHHSQVYLNFLPAVAVQQY